jgi:hypothetical protein
VPDRHIAEAAQGHGNNRAGRKKIDEYARRLTETIRRIPASSFGYDDKRSLWGLSTDERREVLTLLGQRP